jgi:hypothetical protein
MIFTEKQRFVLQMIKVASGIAGVAVVLNENHPYLTVGILVVGALANEALNYKPKKDTP